VKSNIDSGIFQAIQYAGIAALEGPQDFLKEYIAIYQRRRDTLIEGLTSLGWKAMKPQATFYVWAHVPEGFSSADTARLLLEKGGIVATPGNGLGECGEGFIRMALTVSEERINEALGRIEEIGRKWLR
jgi:LL-diaminopimelate aminotransferase